MLSGSRDISFMKKIENLLKTAVIKFEFYNLETRFHKRQVSFLIVKTVKCKRDINLRPTKSDSVLQITVCYHFNNILRKFLCSYDTMS